MNDQNNQIQTTVTSYGDSNLVAALLAATLGPVGLWYKGHWGAGFAWLAKEPKRPV
jgi:hypothetical protein